jgi:hypothetical protein
MSCRAVLQAVVRLGLVLSVALSGMTFAANDAEARRGGKVRTVKERTNSHDDASTRRKSDDDHGAQQGADGSSGTYIPRVRSREAARGAETASDAEDPTAPRGLPRNRALTVGPDQDLDVPGCSTGMMCTVCLAGCAGDIGSIVDSQVKTPIPRSRY